MTCRFTCVTLIGFTFVCALTGCGSGISAPTTAPVQGIVLFKNKPLAGVKVSFHPKADFGRVKFVPSGFTGGDGKFQLSTALPNDGAPPGDYSVTFSYPVIQSDVKNSGVEIEVDYWNGKYDDPAASVWLVKVNRGANTLEPFKIE